MEKKPTIDWSALENNIEFCWNVWDEEIKQKAIDFIPEYREFLDSAHTERERVRAIVKKVKTLGFKEITLDTPMSHLFPGEKVFYINKGKNLALAIIGKSSMLNTTHILGSHLDTPRIDLKIRPLYEETQAGLVMAKTHYYGGLKKYNWMNVPFILSGFIVKPDGTEIKVEIGNDLDDPIFIIPELLVHFSRTLQAKRDALEAIKANEMNVVIGSLPFIEETDADSDSNKVKSMKNAFLHNILLILNEKYGITEADFQSAEISLVPGLKTRYAGIDKGFIAGPGQDDGVCAFTSLKALLALKEAPPQTTIVSFFDKEEVGSWGATSAQSTWFKFMINDLLVRTGIEDTNLNLNRVLTNIKMISADVGAAINPNFKTASDSLTSCITGKGMMIEKWGGIKGKYNTSDASAEFMGYMRNILDHAKVPYQISTMGDVDKGGGGTIAKFFAQQFNCEIVDAGPSVLNMHSPFEMVHIADIYSTYLAYLAFIEFDDEQD